MSYAAILAYGTMDHLRRTCPLRSLECAPRLVPKPRGSGHTHDNRPIGAGKGFLYSVVGGQISNRLPVEVDETPLARVLALAAVLEAAIDHLDRCAATTSVNLLSNSIEPRSICCHSARSSAPAPANAAICHRVSS